MWYIRAHRETADRVLLHGQDILDSPGMQRERTLRQHDNVDCFTHSVCVAYMSLRVARALHVRVEERSLVRGCLLHDYFLYDWHDRAQACRFHTVRHPRIALSNAERDFTLNPLERQIILKHMFPLCFPFPHNRECYIISVADKICAFSESFHLYSLDRIAQMIDGGLHRHTPAVPDGTPVPA